MEPANARAAAGSPNRRMDTTTPVAQDVQGPEGYAHESWSTRGCCRPAPILGITQMDKGKRTRPVTLPQRPCRHTVLTGIGLRGIWSARYDNRRAGRPHHTRRRHHCGLPGPAVNVEFDLHRHDSRSRLQLPVDRATQRSPGSGRIRHKPNHQVAVLVEHHPGRRCGLPFARRPHRRRSRTGSGGGLRPGAVAGSAGAVQAVADGLLVCSPLAAQRDLEADRDGPSSSGRRAGADHLGRVGGLDCGQAHQRAAGARKKGTSRRRNRVVSIPSPTVTDSVDPGAG
ncbi:hypothetical protein IW245_000694 [Longispora fulva]|uniref:Uncharacterized protein n=1 Tax=Longispora fulva TaxID=619741 RepID=A0A8J7G7S8_9ACTN|nr:hypothetical protein [Longispora fulva]